jgi:hypothetical protein
MAEEEWRKVDGFPYEVSSLGRVRNLDHHIIKPFCNNGYNKVQLHRKGQKNKNMRVATLVANAFLVQEEGKTQVNHKDGDKLNNCVQNLEWVSAKENMRHYYDNFNRPRRVMLEVEDGDDIFLFDSIAQAAEVYDLSVASMWGYSLNGKFDNKIIRRIIL